MKKQRILAVLILLMMWTGMTVSGETVTLRLGNTNSGQLLRFQVNGEKLLRWEKLDREDPVIRYETNDKENDTIYLQQKSGLAWSASTRLQFDADTEQWLMLTDIGTFNRTAAAALKESEEVLETVRLRITTKRGEVESYRFQINGEAPDGWTVLEGDTPVAEWVTCTKSDDIFFFQYTMNGRTWSASTLLSFNEEKDSWGPYSREEASVIQSQSQSNTNRSSLQSSMSGSYVLPLVDVPDTLYTEGYQGTVRITKFVNSARSIALFSDAFYLQGNPQNRAVETIREGGLGLGLGYRSSIGGLAIQPEIGGGLLVHVPMRGEVIEGIFYDGFAKAGLTLSLGISDEQELFVQGGVMAYQDGKFDFLIQGNIAVGVSAEL